MRKVHLLPDLRAQRDLDAMRDDMRRARKARRRRDGLFLAVLLVAQVAAIIWIAAQHPEVFP